MEVIESGHIYKLQHLGTEGYEIIKFIRRSSKAVRYETEHIGTNSQEVMRVLINRTEFLHDVLPAVETKDAAYYLRMALFCYEARAYRRKQAKLNKTELINEYEERYKDIPFNEQDIEKREFSNIDGHIILI